jgi:hypothetical protein
MQYVQTAPGARLEGSSSSKATSDETLLALIANGNKDAVRVLFARHLNYGAPPMRDPEHTIKWYPGLLECAAHLRHRATVRCPPAASFAASRTRRYYDG